MKKFVLEQWAKQVSLDPLTLLTERVDFTDDEVWAIKAEMYNIPSVNCCQKVNGSEIVFYHKKSPKYLCCKESIFYKVHVLKNYGSSKVREGETIFVYREVKPNGKVNERYYGL